MNTKLLNHLDEAGPIAGGVSRASAVIPWRCGPPSQAPVSHPGLAGHLPPTTAAFGSSISGDIRARLAHLKINFAKLDVCYVSVATLHGKHTSANVLCKLPYDYMRVWYFLNSMSAWLFTQIVMASQIHPCL